MTDAGAVDPRLVGAVDLLGRTGAKETQVRYCDEEQPVVWMVAALYDVVPVDDPDAAGVEHWEVAAALEPVRAALRLCELVIDGGRCRHCHRPTGLEPDHIETMPFNRAVCWYQWDPELRTFRRGCEGDTPAPNRAARRGRR